MIPVKNHLNVPFTNASRMPGNQGEVRAINGHLEVYDGYSWKQIYTTTYIDDFDLKTVVEWAKQKMEQELQEQELAEKYPAFKFAKEKYQLVKAMVENE